MNSCVCEGNWRDIIKESEPLFGKHFFDTHNQKVYRLGGVVWAGDDYYYLMYRPEMTGDKYVWVSCVMSLEMAGFQLIRW